MEIEAILGELEQNRGYFPREAVEAAIQRREEIAPRLLHAIEDATRHASEWEDTGRRFLLLYAMFLLAQFRDRRAYPLVVNLCKLPRDLLDLLLGDTITEGLKRIIASVFDGDTAHVKSVIEDTTLDEFVRGAALRSLAILVRQGTLERAEVIAYYTELFRGKFEKEESHLWNVLVSEAVDLHATTLADDIRAADTAARLDAWGLGLAEVDEVFALPEETALSEARERCRGLIDDTVREMHWWACFNPEGKSGTKSLPAPPPRREHVPVAPSEWKTSRNARCPCGSGKKYKKCCGAK